MTTLKERFAQLAIHRPEITQADLARHCGVKAPSVSAWFLGGTRSLKGDTAACVAKLYGVDYEWLTKGKGEMLQTTTEPESVRFLTYPPQPASQTWAGLRFAGKVSASKVKVAGMARLGADGFFEEMSGANPAASGMVDAISDDPAAYAMCISGDAGFPAIRDGEYIVVEPSMTPGPTDRVVIALRDGRTMLQELLVDKAESITVVCLDGTNRRTILRSEIRADFGVQTVTNIVSPRKWTPDTSLG